MASGEETQGFVRSRAEQFYNAHNSYDYARTTSFFADNVEYDDFTAGIEMNDKLVVSELLQNSFDSVKDFTFTVKAVNGTKEFNAVEWYAEGVLLGPFPGLDAKVGDTIKNNGCTLFYWDMTHDNKGMGLIKKMSNYWAPAK